MKVVFDTNVVLDAILERNDFQDAQALTLAAAKEEIAGVVTANSITDIYYVTRKKIGEQGAREMVAQVLSVFDVTYVDGDACAMALNAPMKDYEDAVLAVCAAREDADYIATSDQGFLNADSPVAAMSPKELLDLIREGS